VIRTVHSVLLVVVGFVPGHQAYPDLTRSSRQRFSVRRGRCHRPWDTKPVDQLSCDTTGAWLPALIIRARHGDH
jgi:hypothetical protein